MPRSTTPPTGAATTGAVPAHAFGALSPALAVAIGVLVITALLVPTALLGVVGPAPAVLVLGLLLAWGWPGMLGLSSPRGSETALALSALAVTASVSGFGDLEGLRVLAVAGGVSVLIVLFHQLLRRDGRPRLAESVSGNLLGVTVLLSGACLVEGVRVGLRDEVAVALTAGAAAAVLELAGRWAAIRPWTGGLSVLAGVGLGLGAGVVPFLDVDPGLAVVVGVVSAAVATALRAVLSGLPALGHARPRLAAAAASVLVVGAVPLLVGLIARSLRAVSGA